MSKLKICHVVMTRHKQLKSSDQQILLLMKEQLANGHEVAVVTPAKTLFYQEAEKLDCEVVIAKKIYKSHRHFLNSHKYVVHAHDELAIKWAYIHSLFMKVPYVVTYRHDKAFDNSWLVKRAYNNAGCIVGISQHINSRIQKEYPKVNNLLIPDSPQSYSVTPYQVKQIWHRIEGKFLVIQVGELAPYKGWDVTLEAAKKLQQLDDNIQIIILGKGEMESVIENQIAENNLTNVSLMGHISSLGNWLEAADLLINPVHAEGLGAMLLDAMLAEVPIIATKVGGIPDIIEDGYSGILIEDNDHEALAKYIHRLASEPELKDMLTQSASASLEPFMIEKTAEQYLTLYQSFFSK